MSSMAFKYLRTSNLKNKTVFLRVDVNEPIDEHGNLSDDFRIQSVIPTIKLLRQRGCKVIICAHLGRPEGKRLKELSLYPVARHLAALLDLPFQVVEKSNETPAAEFVFVTGDITTKAVQTVVTQARGSVVMLENIRYYPEEDNNSAAFSKLLASFAGAYVNEAFSVSHRKAASIVGIAKYLPGYVGLTLEKEIAALSRVLDRPKSPFVLMMAGIKISDKEKTLKNLVKRADHILVGGGIANVFFLARGFEVGLSKVEAEGRKLAWQMEKNFKGKLVFPDDVVVANKNLDKASIRVCAPHEVHKRELILDIGPKTILKYARIIKTARTLVWNGPLGHFEHKPFHTGTVALARVVGGVSKGQCFGVVGGGETVDAIRLAHQADYIDHLSTGGGAMLEYLAGDKLPGIEALK